MEGSTAGGSRARGATCCGGGTLRCWAAAMARATKLRRRSSPQMETSPSPVSWGPNPLKFSV